MSQLYIQCKARVVLLCSRTSNTSSGLSISIDGGTSWSLRGAGTLDPYNFVGNEDGSVIFGDWQLIHNTFIEDPEYYMLRYNRGIDQFIYENTEYLTYTREDKYCSYQTITEKKRGL